MKGKDHFRKSPDNTHRWRVRDLVICDNRRTMRRRTEFDELCWKRDMQRATVSDAANSCE
jgi:alpha-ketoglutarate-dependent 2,4-dichlorophenoxyacetate dioxygenase